MAKKIILITVISLFAIALVYYISLVALFHINLKTDYKNQEIAYNELVKNSSEPIDMSLFVDFDVSTSELKLNEIAFLATHNSFKKMPPMYISYPASIVMGANVRKNWYELPPFTAQLNNGYRGLEIDISCYNGKFLVIHDPYKDWRAHSPDFEIALREIKLWSDRNPNHTPINLMLQIRNQFGVFTTKFEKMTTERLEELDKLIVDIFGDSVITPRQVKGEYDTLNEAVLAQAWPEVRNSLGKVFFTLLIDEKEIEESYINIDPTFSTQQAFLFHRYGEDEFASYTAFILADNPFEKGLKKLVNSGYILRTRIDEEKNHTEERFDATIALGSTILATDYPVGHSYNDEYVCKLTEDGKTVIARRSING